MRLQLILLFTFISFSFLSFGQKKERKVDVNFALNYYDQNGENSAVEGGRGTQKLDDLAARTIIAIDLDSANKFSLNMGLSQYSSASTDRINNNLSSASSSDSRIDLEMAYTRKVNDSLTRGFSLFASKEYDVTSFGIGGNLKRAKVKYGTYGVSLNGIVDAWQLIYPDELRSTTFKEAPTSVRTTIVLKQTYKWSISKRTNAALNFDFTFQNGLLSTPFHRVYFNNNPSVAIEQLPEQRLKFPLGLQVNTFATGFLILKTNTRLYTDDFGVNAFTLELKPVFLISKSLSVAPLFRYHVQSASKYFNPFEQNDFNDNFYTSDYDLSAFNSQKIGFLMKYHPLYGILGKNRLGWKNIAFQYSNYTRSDGLKASIVGITTGFSFN